MTLTMESSLTDYATRLIAMLCSKGQEWNASIKYRAWHIYLGTDILECNLTNSAFYYKEIINTSTASLHIVVRKTCFEDDVKQMRIISMLTLGQSVMKIVHDTFQH